MRSAVIFMIRHCCRLWHSATEDIACTTWRPLTVQRLAVLPLLEFNKLGRWDARRPRIALCAVPCVHGSSAMQRLRLHVCTLTRTLSHATGLGSGHGAVSAPLCDHWFGPRGS